MSRRLPGVDVPMLLDLRLREEGDAAQILGAGVTEVV
jgi:hypothetical protein